MAASTIKAPKPPHAVINGVSYGGLSCPVLCSYCKRNISLLVRVQCAECSDFRLCGDCFCTGVTLKPHDPTHSYRLADCLDFPIFAKDWSAQEELLLLEGIEKFGAGNWKTIGEYIHNTLVPQGTSKTPAQVEKHYWEHYLGVHGYILPTKAYTQGNELVDTKSLLTSEDGWRQRVVEPYTLGEAVVRDRPVAGTSLSSSSSSSSSAAALSSSAAAGAGVAEADAGDSQVDKKRKIGSVGAPVAPVDKDKPLDKAEELRQRLLALPGADLPGFLPLREDFDVEHDNDAELLLAEMEFSPEDHPSERALKLEVIQIYNKKLDERNKRKRFAIDRGLVDFKKQQQQERKRTKEERDLVARLRIFARFQTAEEHEALVDGLIKARKLRSQIALYQHYRRMGVRTLEQGRAYEVERKKRETELKAQKQRQQTPYLFQPPAGAAAGSTAAAAAASSQASTSDAVAPGNPLDGGAVGGGRRRGPGQGEEQGARGSKRSADDAAAIISKAPGFELLSPKEAELCVAVPMLPMHFLAAKEALVREAYRNGSLTLEGMTRVIKLETPKAAEVYDFFVRETGLGGEGTEVTVGVASNP